MNEKNEQMYELLTYLVTSSAKFTDEPHYYGQLRMIEAAQRLVKILLLEDPENQGLIALRDRIEQDKHTGSSDLEKFQSMLDESVMLLLDCIPD